MWGKDKMSDGWRERRHRETDTDIHVDRERYPNDGRAVVGREDGEGD